MADQPMVPAGVNPPPGGGIKGGLTALMAKMGLPSSAPLAETGAAIAIEQPLLDAAGWYEVWMGKVSLNDRRDMLEKLMVEEGVSEEWLAKFRKMGKKLLRLPPKEAMVLREGLNKTQQAAFELNWKLARRFPGTGGIPANLHDDYFKEIISRLKKAPGIPPERLAEIEKLTAKGLRKMGPMQALSTLETARPNSAVGNIWRWFLQDTEMGKAPPHLSKEVQKVVAQQLEKTPTAPVSAKGMVGKTVERVSKAFRRVGVPGALPAASEEAVKAFRGAGVKRLGKGAMALSKAGGLGPVISGAVGAYTAYSAMTASDEEAKNLYESFSRGEGMGNPSETLLRDFVNKRDTISQRRAMLQKDPALLEKVVQAIAGSSPSSPYTSSEIPMGNAPPGPTRRQSNTEDFDTLLGEFLSQLGNR